MRSTPDLINNCIEESLRYDAPILFNWRVLREPYEIDNVIMPVDSVIWPMLACANRDPRRFENPDEFLIDRKGVTHQSFGGDNHFCLGNMLAKVEALYLSSQKKHAVCLLMWVKHVGRNLSSVCLETTLYNFDKARQYP